MERLFLGIITSALLLLIGSATLLVYGTGPRPSLLLTPQVPSVHMTKMARLAAGEEKPPATLGNR